MEGGWGGGRRSIRRTERAAHTQNNTTGTNGYALLTARLSVPVDVRRQADAHAILERSVIAVRLRACRRIIRRKHVGSRIGMDGWCREVDRGSGRGLCSLRSGTLGENDDREEKKQRKLHHLHRGVLVVPWPRWGCAGAGAVVSVREAIGGRGVLVRF